MTKREMELSAELERWKQECAAARKDRQEAWSTLQEIINEMRQDIQDRNPAAFATRGKIEPGYVEALHDVVSGLEETLAQLKAGKPGRSSRAWI